MSHITDTNRRAIYFPSSLIQIDPDVSWSNNILVRASNLVAIPVTIIWSIGLIAAGVISSVGVILSFSLYKPLNKFASRCFVNGFSSLVVYPFHYLLKTLNPSAPIYPFFQAGIVYGIVFDTLSPIQRDLLNSNNLFLRHIASRGLALTAIPITLIATVIDLSIGLIAATFSIGALGYCESFNTTAWVCLSSIIMISGLFAATVSVINPWAFQ